MSQQVVTGALIKCAFGVAPSALTVPPVSGVLAGNLPAATIMDHIPMVNIMPFGMCSAPSNPAVISATAAALGVFTPMPCVPVTPGPWAPGSPTVLVGNKPALNNTSKCMCTWGGVISVVQAGQLQAEVP